MRGTYTLVPWVSFVIGVGRATLVKRYAGVLVGAALNGGVLCTPFVPQSVCTTVAIGGVSSIGIDTGDGNFGAEG